MVVFKYIEDKDVFQKFYSKMLAKRLCQHMSASDDAEASMISKLKQACGFEYTSKLQRMFQDIGVSKDLNDQYRKHHEKLRDTRSTTQNEIDFSILVLSSGSWPFGQGFTFSLPFEVCVNARWAEFLELLTDILFALQLEQSVHRFNNFYAKQHSGRKLNWLYNMCRGELITNCFRMRYTLQVWYSV